MICRRCGKDNVGTNKCLYCGNVLLATGLCGTQEVYDSKKDDQNISTMTDVMKKHIHQNSSEHDVNSDYRAAFLSRVERNKRKFIIMNIVGMILAVVCIAAGWLLSDTFIGIFEDPLYTAIYLGVLYLILICLWIPIIIRLKKAKKQQHDTVPLDIPEGDIRRTITIVRKKSMYGAAVPIMCFINEQPVCSLKNGKALAFEIGEGSFFLRAESGFVDGYIDIPVGNEDLTYEVSVKMGMVANTLEFRRM